MARGGSHQPIVDSLDGRRLAGRWLAAICGAATAVLAVLARRFEPENNDAVQFYIGAASLRRSGSPYALSAANLSVRATHWAYCYPPAMAYLWLPLTCTGVAAASWLWLGVSVIATAVLGWELAAIAAEQGRGRVAVLLGASLILFPPHAQGLQIGQAHAVLAALIAGAALALVRGRELLAGLLLGIASTLKLFPGLLAVACLVAGRRRSAAAAAAVIAAVGLLLWRQHLTFVREYVLAGFYPTAAFFNISVHGLAARLFEPSAYGVAVADAPRAALALKLALCLGTLVLLLMAIRRQKRWQARWAAFLPAMLLWQPIAGIYHLNLLLLAIAMLGPATIWSRQRLLLLISLVLCALPVDLGLGSQALGAGIYRFLHTGWGLLLGVPQLYGTLLLQKMMACHPAEAHLNGPASGVDPRLDGQGGAGRR